jgi:hypothetical protein
MRLECQGPEENYLLFEYEIITNEVNNDIQERIRSPADDIAESLQV